MHRLSFLMCLPAPGASTYSNNTNSSSHSIVPRPHFPSESRANIYIHLRQVCAFKALKFPHYGAFLSNFTQLSLVNKTLWFWCLEMNVDLAGFGAEHMGCV